MREWSATCGQTAATSYSLQEQVGLTFLLTENMRWKRASGSRQDRTAVGGITPRFAKNLNIAEHKNSIKELVMEASKLGKKQQQILQKGFPGGKQQNIRQKKVRRSHTNSNITGKVKTTKKKKKQRLDSTEIGLTLHYLCD